MLSFPLRIIFNKIRFDSPGVNFGLALRLAIKTMKDTMEPEGLVPSYLVFEILPRHRCLNTKLPLQAKRMKLLQNARAEMASIVSEMHISEALRSKPPSVASIIHAPGDMVRLYLDNDKKFLGPFLVIKVEDKEIFVDYDGPLEHINCSQVIPENY